MPSSRTHQNFTLYHNITNCFHFTFYDQQLFLMSIPQQKIRRTSSICVSAKPLFLLFLAWNLAFLLQCQVAEGFQTLTTTVSQTHQHVKNQPDHVSSPRMSYPQKQATLTFQKSATTDDNESDDVQSSSSSTLSKTEKRILLVWFHSVVAFVIWNYYTTTTLWPAFFLDIPIRFWNLLHALSAMAFAGGIVTTTLLEWKIPPVGSNKERSMVLDWLWQVESKLVLPAVSMSLISGVVQAHAYYSTLRAAPPHVKGALHIMVLFGMWWAWTDRRSQASLREGGFDESKVIQRRLSNIVSCGFLVALYSMMILKPGF